MSCNQPRKGFKIGYTKNGKDNYKITDYRVHHIEHVRGKWINSYVTNISPQADKVVSTFVEIPCGQCLGCRIDYKKKWADRCSMEMKYYDRNLFITLTYDPQHVPKSGVKQFDSDTGEYLGLSYEGDCMSLRKEDLQKFFKRLRKNTKQKFRYFACGEYGDGNGQTRIQDCRPHYHFIAFGLELPDMVPIGNPKRRGCYYTSELLSKCWPYGKSIVAEATYETCSYTAGYVMKKLKGPAADFYKLYDIEPEFVTMSRRPGIGRQFYEDNKQKFIDYSSVAIGDSNGSHNIKPNDYFKKLLDIDYPDEWNLKKESNKSFAEDHKKLILKTTSKPYLDMLADKEVNLKANLKRKKERSVR